MRQHFNHKISVLINDEDLQRLNNIIEKYSNRYGLTYSTFIREALIEKLDRIEDNADPRYKM